MRLVRLIDAAESETPLGEFLGALMREFKPDPFVMLVGQLERNAGYVATRGNLPEREKYAALHMRDLKATADKFGLVMTAASAMTSYEQLEDKQLDPKPDLVNMAAQMRRMVTLEMEQLCYFEIPKEQIRYWKDAAPFGDKVAQGFKAAAHDIEEASKCLALGRYTASAFHSIRVLEAAINALGLSMGVTLPEKNERTWKRVLKSIRSELDSREQSVKKEWVTRYPALESAYGFLSNAKNAWRDDTMHVGAKYNEEEAKRVFDSTKILMGHLAEWINEEGHFQK